MPTPVATPLRSAPPLTFSNFTPSSTPYHYRALMKCATALLSRLSSSPAPLPLVFGEDMERLDRAVDEARRLTRLLNLPGMATSLRRQDMMARLVAATNNCYSLGSLSYERSRSAQSRRPDPIEVQASPLTLSQVAKQLQLLCDSAPGRVVLSPEELVYRTNPIYIGTACFGQYDIHMRIPSIERSNHPQYWFTPKPGPGVISAYRPHEQPSPTGTIHPHIRGGAMCMGEGSTPFRRLFLNCDFIEAFDILEAILNNKTPHDGYGYPWTWFFMNGNQVPDPDDNSPRRLPIPRPMLGYVVDGRFFSQEFKDFSYMRRVGEMPFPIDFKYTQPPLVYLTAQYLKPFERSPFRGWSITLQDPHRYSLALGRVDFLRLPPSPVAVAGLLSNAARSATARTVSYIQDLLLALSPPLPRLWRTVRVPTVPFDAPPLCPICTRLPIAGPGYDTCHVCMYMAVTDIPTGLAPCFQCSRVHNPRGSPFPELCLGCVETLCQYGQHPHDLARRYRLGLAHAQHLLCGNCGQPAEVCTCERCDDCGELIHNCACETEPDTDDDGDIDEI